MAYDYEIGDIYKYNLKIDDNLFESENLSKPDVDGVESNLIEKVLSEKLNRIKDTIRLIGVLITERKEIKEKIINGLSSQIIDVKNLILKAEPIIPGYTRLTEVQASLEREIFKLEKAKLDEEVATWRDVLGLKKKLIDLTNELRAAEDKVKLFKK